jgi:hypothetical protein
MRLQQRDDGDALSRGSREGAAGVAAAVHELRTAKTSSAVSWQRRW